MKESLQLVDKCSYKTTISIEANITINSETLEDYILATKIANEFTNETLEILVQQIIIHKFNQAKGGD